MIFECEIWHPNGGSRYIYIYMYIYMHTHHKVSHGNREMMVSKFGISTLSWFLDAMEKPSVYLSSFIPTFVSFITRSTIVDHVNHYLDPFVEEFFTGSNHFEQNLGKMKFKHIHDLLPWHFSTVDVHGPSSAVFPDEIQGESTED